MTVPARFLLKGRLPGRAERGPVAVLVEAGRVAAVGSDLEAPAGTEPVGGEDHVLVPGFIDLQVNGYGGLDAVDGVDAMVEIARRLPRHGVTAFLPTAITAPPERLAAFVAAAAEADRRSGPQAARILGAHLEGPFLNPEFAGAHDRSLMRNPAPRELDRLLAEGAPRMVTLAPELPHALDAVARLSAAGVLVSAGHSAATLEEARAGFQAGIRFGTHLFNAMTGIHHRRPGLAAALLDEPGVTCGLIADGLHVHPVAIALALRAKGGRGIALTTDQTAAAGAPPGAFRLGDRDVVSDGVTVRLADGTLAGSTATMDALVRLVARLPGAGLAEAVRMATATPASVLGLGRRLGRIAPGLPADVALLGPDGDVRLTLVGGHLAHRVEPAR